MECESFTVVSIDSLLVYENQILSANIFRNCVYKIANKHMTDYLGENI